MDDFAALLLFNIVSVIELSFRQSWTQTCDCAELQVRGSIEDNSKIIFIIS